MKLFDFQGGLSALFPCRDRPDRGVLRVPVRGLRAHHGAAAAPPEHRHDPAHRQDDRGGEHTPQSA